ncbi:MAG TPA: efflux RND transporter periplasmic adaptor subunit [Gammaproteobacteria bacterium]|nr:efflux RND transporter periplasmic adaptor subunit [Gammaproteobacteria bacterium]
MQVTPRNNTCYRSHGRLGHALAIGTLLFALAGVHEALAEPVPVRTTRLADLLQVPTYSAPATVMPHNTPRLAAEIDARILEVKVEVGDRVVSGQVLVRLDCRHSESVLAAARAALDRAKAQQQFAAEQLTRARNLGRNKSISEELVDQRRTDLAVTEADRQAAEEVVRQAAIDAGHCEIKAPFDAVVTERLASTGGFANRGTVIVGLLEATGQEVSAALRHEQIAGLQEAESIFFDANGDRYPVTVRTLLPLADTTARTLEARLAFTADSAIAGTAGRILWTGRRELLPADYLVRRNGSVGLFLLEADRARFVALPDAEDGRPARVTLDPESLLITDGRQRLSDGDEVQPAIAGDKS